jgi:hypothetical protein
MMFCWSVIPNNFSKDPSVIQNQTEIEEKDQIHHENIETTEIHEDEHENSVNTGDFISDVNIEPPKPSQFSDSYQHLEYPLNDNFDRSNIAPWTEYFLTGSESSGFGFIYCQGGLVYMKGTTQKVSIPGVGTVPEMPDDMAIRSGNIANPANPWGTGQLIVRFTPHNIVDGWDYYTYNNIPIPFPVYRSFEVQYRTSSDGSFSTLYSYSNAAETTQTVEISLNSVFFTNYFELSLRLLAYDVNDWVEVDFAIIKSFEINVTESKASIPSNEDMELTVNFLQTFFSMNWNGATIAAYVNPDGGIVDATCASFTAAGNNSNPYTIIINSNLYIQGIVTYKIRFQSTAGHIFWSPTFQFHCYDNDPPTTIVTNFNATIGYHQNLLITANINDTGGSGLSTAKVVWDYNQVPTESSSLSVPIQTSPNGVDNYVATFMIPTEFLKYGFTLRFQVWVYDRAGNKGSSSLHNVNPTDYIPPEIDLWEKSFWWDSGLSRNIVDLGYPLIAKWSLNEPTQASGIPNSLDFRYVAIKVGDIAPAHPADYTGGPLEFTSIASNDYIFELNHGYSAGTWFHLIIYAEDNAYNVAWTYYTLYVADRRAPDIIESGNNQIPPNFNQSLTLNFSASEPSSASGVNEGSISFQYSINNQGLGSTQTPTIQNGGIYYNRTYTIPHSEYDWGDIIYYRYSVADNDGNQYTTGIRSLTVNDPYLPTLSITTDYYVSNWSIVYSYFDISIKCTASDQFSEGGSGLDFVRLYIRNGSQFVDYSNVLSWKYFDAQYNLSNTEFFFLIPENDVTIEGIAIAIRAYDKAGNYREWTVFKDVIDATRPIVKRYNLGTTYEYYLNRLTTNFYFELSIEAYIFYAVDGEKSTIPIEGKSFTVPITFSGEGPHTVTVFFNDYIWFRTVIVDLTSPPPVTSINAELRGRWHYISWSRPQGLGQNEEVIYYLYRGTIENFAIEDGELVISTQELNYDYKFDETGSFYYRVVVYDLAMNPSGISPTSNRILMVESTTTAISITVIIIIAAVISLTAVAVIRYRRFYGIVRDPSKSKFVALWKKFKAQQYAKKFRERFNFAVNEKVKQHNELKTTSDDIKPNKIVPVKPEKAEKYIPIPTTLPKELEQVKTRLSPEAQKLLAQNEVKEIDEAINKVTAVKKKGDDGWMEEVKGDDDGWV